MVDTTLSGWDEFESKIGKLNIPRTPRSQAIYDFKSRWLISSRFAGIKLTEDYKTEGVPNAYGVLARLILAYSSREQLVAVINPKGKHFQLPVTDSLLAQELRSALNAEGRQQLLAESMEKKGRVSAALKERYEDFSTGKSDDIQPVLCLLRNAAAHGSITPTGAGLTKNAGLIVLIGRATDSLLLDSAARFARWVAEGGVDALRAEVED